MQLCRDQDLLRLGLQTGMSFWPGALPSKPCAAASSQEVTAQSKCPLASQVFGEGCGERDRRA